MNSKERWLLDCLKNYIPMKVEILSIKERIENLGYRMTACYGFNAGGSGGYGGSKVETLGNKRVELERELHRKEELIEQIEQAIERSGLDKRERDLVSCTIGGMSLSGYARQSNIYKSHVYKIRDNALKKMVKHISCNTK